MNHDFRASHYFGELDGLRAVSILLVVTIHTTDPIWRVMHGNVGVTIFFIISGFIITTLLLREEQATGQVRLGAFYLRRAFRILPLYYVMLAVYVVLIGILRVQAGAGDLWHALPYYLIYQNDLISSDSGFSITWSLAIEEKFYLLWPLTFLAIGFRRFRRWRLPLTLFLLLATAPFALAPGRASYPAIYVPILLGCLVAQLMHRPATYAALAPLRNGFVAVALIVVAAAEVVMFEGDGNVHVIFALLAAAALPAFLTGPDALRVVFRSRILVYIGTRSYALYLVHRLAKGFIDRLIGPDGNLAEQLSRVLLIVALGLLLAEVLRRTVEQPMIALGRRLSARQKARAAARSENLAPKRPQPLQPQVQVLE